MNTLLLTLMVSNLFGCTKQEVISGGTVDNSDPDAPEVIESKDIVQLTTNFYLSSRYSGDENHFFDFEIKKNDKGILEASEKNNAVSFAADKELLDSLQEVIDKYELVKQNGIDNFTAGLAPEYQPCHLEVIYASNERLYFRYDNDPSAKWAQSFYDIFAKWFADKGIDSLYPEKETSTLERIDIRIIEDDIHSYYHGTNVSEDMAIDGDKYLLNKSVYDDGKKESLVDEFIRFPDDYFVKISQILDKHDTLRKYDFSYSDHRDGYYGFSEESDAKKEDGNVSVDIYIKYESGRILNIETSKSDEIEAMSPLLNDLRDYCDSLFEK